MSVSSVERMGYIYEIENKNPMGALGRGGDGGNAAAGTVFAVSFERQFDLWI